MKKSLIWMACVGLCALALAACSKEDRFSAGKRLHADDAQDMREKLLAEQAQAPATEEKEPEVEVEDALPVVCYYTEKGGKWHASANCRYLKNSTDILEGSVEGANYAGKNQPCSVCAAAYIKE